MSVSSSSASADTPPDTLSKTPTSLSKDRICPFCEQAFTSSSLGRHLDLYIREKNPKPPDGIHDVEEIRKMRRKITRRQPKGSGVATAKRKAEADNGPVNTSTRKIRTQETTDDLQERRSRASTSQLAEDEPTQLRENRISSTNLNDAYNLYPNTNQNNYSYSGQRDDPVRTGGIVNFQPIGKPPDEAMQLGWQATGVIRDIPLTGQSSPKSSRNVSFTAGNVSNQQYSYTDSTNVVQSSATSEPLRGMSPGEESSVTRIALRDVLRSLQRAQTRLSEPEAFKFDVLSLNYPALCLRLLGAPKALFSSTPMESAMNAADFWPLGGPPTAAHKPKLLQNIRARVKLHMYLCPPHETRLAETRQEGVDVIEVETEKRCISFFAHVEGALQQWESFPQQARDEVWKLELMRFSAKSGEDYHILERKLETAQDLAEGLKEEISRLRESNLQLAKHRRGSGINHPQIDLSKGSADSAPHVPVVDVGIAREMEAMWTESATRGGGGWMDGAGLDRWDFSKVIDRYKSLVVGGRTRTALWPGDALKEFDEDQQAADRVDVGVPASHNGADVSARSQEQLSRFDLGFGPAVSTTWRPEDLIQRGGPGWTAEDLAKRGLG
ncbi:MAG: hypothetical protein Q9162_004682 [Coniocarpon cinnabarinum]